MKHDSVPQSHNFFTRRDPWGHGIALWVGALLLFLAPLSAAALLDLRLDNSVENWLPEQDEQSQVYRWCRGHFPEKETVVVTWDGSTLDDPRLPLFKARLEGRLDADGVRRDGIPYVATTIDARQIVETALQYHVEVEEAVQRLQGTLVGTGWVKLRLTPAGTDLIHQLKPAIVEQGKQKFGLDITIHDPLQTWGPATSQEEQFQQLVTTWLPATTGANASDTETDSETANSLCQIQTPFQPHDLQLSWSGMSGNPKQMQLILEWLNQLQGGQSASNPAGESVVEKAFLQIGSPVAMVVVLSEAGLADKSAAMSAIRDAAEACMIPDESLLLGGRAVASVALNEGVIEAAYNRSPSARWYQRSVIGLSGLVGIVFALVSLRNLRLGLLVIGISYYTSLIGTALVPVSGGSMNLVLVVMPTLLMVITLSGAIHVANYWQHVSAESPHNAVSRAFEMAKAPCFMSAFTTALGLISLAGSELLPVRQFGIYSSIGTMISVVLVLYGLPSILQLVPLRRNQGPSARASNGWGVYAGILCRNARVVNFSLILLSAVCICGLRYFRTETKVIKYFPQESKLVNDYRRIEDTLAGISPIEVIVRFNEQSQSELRFLERMEIVRRVEQELRLHPEISGVLALPDFQPVTPVPGDEAKTREKLMYNRRSSEVEKRTKQNEGGSAEFLAVVAPGGGLEIGGTQLGTAGDELWRINIQAAVLSDSDYSNLTTELDERIKSAVGQHAGVHHIVTGTVPLFLRTQQAVLDGLISSTAQAFILIMLVMMYMLRDPLAGALSMIPNVLPIAVVYGVISYLGQHIDVGTMVTASIALGIAVDSTLHLCTWFIDGLRHGKSRENAIIDALSHCGPAMLQTSAAIAISMLVLVPAELLLISRFGWLMAALIGSAFVGSVVLLPAMLMGVMGRMIERRIQRARNDFRLDMAVQRTRSAIPRPHISLDGSSRRVRRQGTTESGSGRSQLK